MSNLRSGFLGFPSLASRSFLSLRARRRSSCFFLSSSGLSCLRSTTEESEFLLGRRASLRRDDDGSVGSAKMSNSPVGRGLLVEPEPAANRLARIASSWDLVGR